MLYLVRHAHALDAEEDSLRPLSDRGRKQVKALSRFLQANGMFQPEDIWHSALVRARETAQLLAQQLKLSAPLHEMPDLRPEDDPHATARRIKQAQRPLAIVGHEPHLSALASLLVVGAMEPPAFVFKKSAVLALEPGGEHWMVRWHLSPELLA
jgi:phosphohistidine phosphatase